MHNNNDYFFNHMHKYVDYYCITKIFHLRLYFHNNSFRRRRRPSALRGRRYLLSNLGITSDCLDSHDEDDTRDSGLHKHDPPSSFRFLSRQT